MLFRSAVNLSGWSVQYSSAAGASWEVTALRGSIPAYGFYLVQERAGTGGTTLLPAPDMVDSISMGATAGKVALVNGVAALTGSNPVGGAAVVDFVGYGTASAYEGTGPAGAPGNNKSVGRSATPSGFGNGYDTNDNVNDFVPLTPPQPQNSTVFDATPYPVSALVMLPAANGSMLLTWNAPVGNATGVVCLMRGAGHVATTVPSLPYAMVSGANTVFAAAADAEAGGFGVSGDRLVYRGNGTTVTVTGLAPRTTYHINVLTGSGEMWSAPVARSETALPVELVSFTAHAKNRCVLLTWETASEVNNAGFAVEKKAENTEWTKIAFVDGHGTINAPQTYAFVDACEAGKYTYRLKQIDRDGSFTYSNEACATLAFTAAEYSLGQNHPNPFNSATSIHFAVQKEQHATLVVCTVLGQEVSTLFDGIARENTLYTIAFSGTGLSSGIYFYILHTADRREVKMMSLIK